MKKNYLLLLFLSLFAVHSWGQSIFTNPITDGAPNNANPFTAGQVVNANITVSGIGRGPGIGSNAAANRYNANGWNVASLDANKYFEFTLTPNAGYKINFASFVYTGQASGTGPNSFAFKSSADNFVSIIALPSVGGTTISLAADAFQNVNSAITFRFYAWGAAPSASAGTFSINDFTFNGTVALDGPLARLLSLLPAVNANYITQNTAKNVIYKFRTAVSRGDATVSGVSFATTGNYVSSDFSKFQLWYDTTDNFAAATQLGSDITTSLNTGSHSFSGLSQPITSGDTGFYWITADVTPTATQLDSIAVNAFTTTNVTLTPTTPVASVVAGSTSAGRAQTIIVTPGTSTITAGTTPFTIPSIANTQGTDAAAFSFTYTDDGTTTATDGLPTQITKLIVHQSAGNVITDWTTLIAGAELSDGTNSIAASAINATSITFANIDTTTTSGLGYVADDASKTYTLKVWLKASLSAALQTTVDDLALAFGSQNLDFSISGSQLASAQSVASGAAIATVAVTATQLNFLQQPAVATDVNAVMTPAVTVTATDINNNRDLDFVSDINIASTGTLAATSTNTATPAAGFATFNNIVHSDTGRGLTMTATSAALTSIPSTLFNIYSSADHFRSAANGNWASIATWESSADSITWVPAVAVPTAKAASVNILSGDTVTISTTGVVFDKTIIHTGGAITTTAAYTLADSTGTDLTIEGGASLTVQQSSAFGTGSILVKRGGQITTAGTAANLATPYLGSTSNVTYEDSSYFVSGGTNAAFGTPADSLFRTVNATDMPILKVTVGTPSFGSANPFIVNGHIQTNAAITLNGAGIKTFKGNINGTALAGGLTQGTGGAFILNNNDTLSGTLKFSLGAAGLTIMNGAYIPPFAVVAVTTVSNVGKHAGDMIVDGTLDLGPATFFDTSGNTIVNGRVRTTVLTGPYIPVPFIGGGNFILSPGSIVDYYATSGIQYIVPNVPYSQVIVSGGHKKLVANTTIGTLLTLNTIIELGNADLIMAPTATITGGTATAYVKTDSLGTLKQNVGGTTVTFPVGNKAYDPATLTNTGTADNFGIKVIDTVTADGTATGSSIFSPVVNRTWNITEGTPGGSIVALNLQWNNVEEINTFLESNVFVAHYNSTISNWEPQGGVTSPYSSAPAAVAGTIPGTMTTTAANITTFSPFTVASAGISALDINLTNINAENKGNVNEVSWATAQEDAGDRFELERSADAATFTKIADVNGKGNNSTYAYTDEQPVTGVNYYRLRLVSKAGQTTYSKTVSAIVNGGSNATISVYPNPVQDKLNVSVLNADQTAQLSLINVNGQVVRSITATSGTNTIDVKELPQGVYILKYANGTHTEMVHITKL